MFKLFQKIKSSVEIKDTASSAVKVTYYSKCLNESDQLMQTNKCDGLQVQSSNVPLSALHEYALPIDSNTLTTPSYIYNTNLETCTNITWGVCYDSFTNHLMPERTCSLYPEVFSHSRVLYFNTVFHGTTKHPMNLF